MLYIACLLVVNTLVYRKSYRYLISALVIVSGVSYLSGAPALSAGWVLIAAAALGSVLISYLQFRALDRSLSPWYFLMAVPAVSWAGLFLTNAGAFGAISAEQSIEFFVFLIAYLLAPIGAYFAGQMKGICMGLVTTLAYTLYAVYSMVVWMYYVDVPTQPPLVLLDFLYQGTFFLGIALVLALPAYWVSRKASK